MLAFSYLFQLILIQRKHSKYELSKCLNIQIYQYKQPTCKKCLHTGGNLVQVQCNNQYYSICKDTAQTVQSPKLIFLSCQILFQKNYLLNFSSSHVVYFSAYEHSCFMHKQTHLTHVLKQLESMKFILFETCLAFLSCLGLQIHTYLSNGMHKLVTNY